MATNIQFGEYSPPEDETKRGIVNITIGVYFDGTQNNRKNTQARIGEQGAEGTKAYNKHSDKETDSYENDLSNIARMEIYYIKDDSKYISKVYVEGIGTEDLKADIDDVTNHRGVAYGAGSTGVRAKVKKGCGLTVDKVVGLSGDNDIDILTLDVFGFSRGAAAARNFVYEVTKEKYKAIVKTVMVRKTNNHREKPTEEKRKFDDEGNETTRNEFPKWGHLGILLEEKKIKVNRVNVRFVGLYDTVSSYDPISTEIDAYPNFDNDVEELHLNEMGRFNEMKIRKAKKIIQLAAADEHRENFMLTRVGLAGGIDYFLPGVHSDVGGCYTHNMSELDRQIMDLDNTLGDGLSDDDYDKILNNDLNNLISQGWFKEREVVRPNSWHETKINRKKISNKYSFVTLHILAEIVNNNYTKIIDLEGLTKKYKIPNGTEDEYYPLDLTKVKARLDDYISGKKGEMIYYTNKEIEVLRKQLKEGKMSTERFNTIVTDHNILIELRNRYLHWNSRFGEIGYKPNYTLDKKKLQITRKRAFAPGS